MLARRRAECCTNQWFPTHVVVLLPSLMVTRRMLALHALCCKTPTGGGALVDPTGPDAAWLVCTQRRPARHTYLKRSRIRAAYRWMKVEGASQQTGSETRNKCCISAPVHRQLCAAGRTSQPGSSALHAPCRLPTPKPHSTACDWLADGGTAVAGTAGVETAAQGRELILERTTDACSPD